MLSLPLAFATSLLLGMRHATDADHIVAVSTIVTHERSMRRANWIGVMWGLGHTLTVFVVGGAIVVFKWSIAPWVGLSLEFCVAVMLVVLGMLNLTPHGHAPAVSSHAKPFAIGVVHGLAGSAAATLLILPLMPDVRWAFAYLTVFGIGTIAGMMLVTAAVAAPAAAAVARFATMQRGIRLASGAISVGFGLYLGYQIGFVDGLFMAVPQWEPR